MKEMTPYPESLGSGGSCTRTHTSSAAAGETIRATQAEMVSFPTDTNPAPPPLPPWGWGPPRNPKLSPLLLAMFLITEHRH